MTEEELKLKFGADTSGIDAGSRQAITDIGGIQKAVLSLIESFKAMGSSATGSMLKVGEGAKAAAIGMRESAEHVKLMRESMMGFGEAFLAAFAIEQVAEFAKKMGESGERIEHLSQRLGVSVTDVQALGAAATMSGQTVDAMATAVTRLDRSFAAARQGAKGQQAAFREMGVDISENYTQMQLLEATMEGFASHADGPAKAAAAMQLLGRSGAALIPFLNLGKEGFEELTAAMQKYDVQDAQAVEKAAALGRSVNENKVAMAGLGNIMADAFGPALKNVVDGLNDMIAAFVKSYKEGGMAKQALDLITQAVQAMIVVFMMLAEAIEQAWVIIKGTWRSMVADWALVTDLFKTGIDAIKASFRSLALTIADALVGNWAGAAQHAVAGVNEAASAARAHAARIKQDLKDISTIDAAVTSEMTSHWQSFNANVTKLIKGSGHAGLRTAAGGEGDTSDMATGGGKRAKGPSIVERWRTELADALNEEKNWGQDEAAFSLDFWTKKLALVKSGSKEELEIRREIARAQKAVYQEQHRDALETAKNNLQIALQGARDELAVKKDQIAQETGLIDIREKTGVISAQKAVQERTLLHQQLYALEVQEADREYQLKLAELNAEKADLLTKPAEVARIDREIERLEAEHNGRMKVLSADLAKSNAADLNDKLLTNFNKFNSVFQSIGQSWASVTQGLIQRTMTWGQAFAQIGSQMLSMFLGWCAKMAGQWLAMELAKTVSTGAGTATRTGMEAAANAQGLAMHAASALGHIAMDAARAAAGAWAAIAGIPIIGPFLAPVMAAAALAGVLALGKSIFSAEKGWGRVPYDGAVTELHRDEMVLPASIANPMRSALNDNDRGGGLFHDVVARAIAGAQAKGDSHLHYHAPPVNITETNVKRILENHGGLFLRQMEEWARDGRMDKVIRRASAA